MWDQWHNKPSWRLGQTLRESAWVSGQGFRLGERAAVPRAGAGGMVSESGKGAAQVTSWGAGCKSDSRRAAALPTPGTSEQSCLSYCHPACFVCPSSVALKARVQTTAKRGGGGGRMLSPTHYRRESPCKI